MNDQPERVDSSERGRQSQRKGRSFEEKVADLYRLLHYEVEHGRLFSGRQVDLFLTRRLGDLTIYRAIECKSGQIVSSDLDVFLNKLKLVQGEYPSAQGTLISGVAFSDPVQSHAAAIGVQLTTYRDLSAQLLDGHTYAKNLVKEIESNTRYPLDFYTEQNVSYESSSESILASELISEWLEDKTWNQLTLLGDLGTGKTFLTRVVSYQLAKDFLDTPLEKPLPIRIDLRKADREFSLEGLVLTHMTQSGLEQATFDVFLYSLFEGNIILILDGFDEMSARVSPTVTRRNFNELARCVQGRAKVLLTCRTHYFKSKTEEEQVILGTTREYKSEAARDLYWELISRKGFRIAYLRPFTASQVESYVYRVMPDKAKETLKKLRRTYNLVELSQRPLLLDMIVRSIDKIDTAEINTASLYQVFTDAWIHREQWREILHPTKKLHFLMILAFSLWQDDVQKILYSKLFDYLQENLPNEISTPQDIYVLDNEIRTATFLGRDEEGYYGFAHKSFAEFFLARLLALELKQKKLDCLRIRRLSPEVVSFLAEMIDLTEVKSIFTDILKSEYQPQVSENAVVCLYGLSLKRNIPQKKGDTIKIHLPDNMRLDGARLEQVMLEGAVMRNAGLQKANLSEATLIGADLSDAILDGVNLSNADLQSAVLCRANMHKANLYASNLEDANLQGANLNGSNLQKAILLNASLKNADLTGSHIEYVVLTDGDISRLKNELSSSDAERVFGVEGLRRIEEDRDIIRSILGVMEKACNAASQESYLIEPGEILGRLYMYVMEPRVFGHIKGLAKAELEGFIYSAAYKIVSQIVKQEEGFPRTSFVEPAELDELAAVVEAPDLSIIRRNLWELIEKNLSPDLVRILKARFVDELKLHDIAELEGVSISSIHYRINKALEILRVRLPEL